MSAKKCDIFKNYFLIKITHQKIYCIHKSVLFYCLVCLNLFFFKNYYIKNVIIENNYIFIVKFTGYIFGQNIFKNICIILYS